MLEFLANLFKSDFMPHGYCYLWSPQIVWLHAISDSVIAASYYLIPVALFYFVRHRRDLPFNWMFVMFGIFILGCGTTHVMEVWTLWKGTYRLAGLIKAITAAASVATAALLVPLLPRALALPSPEQLRAANMELGKEISHRRRVEDALHRVQDELELRVNQRTAELAEANEALRQSEERWRAVFENSAVGIVLLDVQGYIQDANSAYQAMVGYSIDELRSLSILDITVEDDRKAADGGLAELVAGTRQHFQIEKRLRCQDGNWIWVNVHGSLVRSTKGAPLFVMAIVENITERKRAAEVMQTARAQLAHMSRVTTMGELTASIAHEINQPLAAVVTNANACSRWLEVVPANFDEARAAIGRIVKEGARASEIIRRIRSLLRKTNPQMTWVDINEVVLEVLALTNPEILRKRVSVRTELETGIPVVAGDRVQLQQVVLNLIMNAVEATQAAKVSSRDLFIASKTQDRGQVVVMVRDSGIGIDPANAEAVFLPFFTTKSEGMGMGLTICRSIIEAHGGRLWASPNQGPGATFQFSIPERAVEAA